MYGKSHSEKALALISKPGKLNPMYGKTHSEITKNLMAKKRNKYLNGVGIFDLKNNLVVKIFDNNVELASYLGISKVTVGKYMNNRACLHIFFYVVFHHFVEKNQQKQTYKDIYIFKPIDK